MILARKTEPASLPVDEQQAFYDVHFWQVSRWAQRLGGTEVDVEDVVHDVFMVAFRKFAAFRGDAKVTTWLFRITERVVFSHRRRTRRRWSLARLAGADHRTQHLQVEQADDQLQQRQTVADLYDAMDRLDDKHRATFILFALDDMPPESIATLQGTSVSTVWVRVHRARKKIQEFLERLERKRARAEVGKR